MKINFENIKKAVKNTIIGSAAVLGSTGAFAKDAPKAEAQLNTKNTIEMKNLQREIDSIQTEKKMVESFDNQFDQKAFVSQKGLENFLLQLDNHEKFADMYEGIKKYIIESSKGYDLLTVVGFKKFQSDMTATFLDPEAIKDTDPALANKLDIFSNIYEHHTDFGANDDAVRKENKKKQIEWIVDLTTSCSTEAAKQRSNQQIAMRENKLDQLSSSEESFAFTPDE